MFDIGFWELALIAVMALIVLGPKRLPEAARFAGKWTARIRNMIATVKDDIDEHLKAEELAELRQLKEELTSAKDSLNQASSDLSQSFQDEMRAIDSDVIPEPEPDYLLKAIEGAEEKNADEGADSDNSKPDKAPASPRDDSKAAK